MSDIKIVGQIELNTGDAAKKIEDVKKGLNDTGEAASKVANSNKEAGVSFNNLKESLTSVSPVANKASESFGIFNNALNVIKGNIIIAVLTGLITVVIGVVKYMKGVDGAADSLNRSWASLSTLMSAFVDKVLSPLIDGFTWLIDNATKLATIIGDFFSPGLKEAADRAGQLRDELNDLEDAQKNNAIAQEKANLRLAEARDIAADANVPIKERIKALKEAAKIEKEQAEEVYKTNLATYRNKLETMAGEMNVRKELIDVIKNGTIAQLEAARLEMLAMKNVNGDKLTALDNYLKQAIQSQSASQKIQTKTEKQISSMEKEEADNRENARKEAAAKAAAARQKENDERVQREQETQRRLKEVLVAGQKAIDDALKVLRVQNRQTELAELKKKFDEDVAAANNAGFSTLRIREAFQKQQDEINFKYDEEQRIKKEGEDDAKNKRIEAMQLRAVTSLTDNLAKQKEVMEQAADSQIELDKKTLAHKQLIEDQMLGILQNASNAFGKETAVGKGIAIAEATISTYLGATKALSGIKKGNPLGAVLAIAQAAAIIKNGFNSIKAMAAVQVPGASGGGGGTPSIAAAAPILPQQTSTSLDSNTIQNIGNAAAGGVNKTYVLSNEIARDREREAQLNRAARL